MKDIQRTLRAAAGRLFLADLLRVLVSTATLAACVLLVLVAVQKLGPWTFRWPMIFAAAAGGSVIVSVLIAAARRPRGAALADEFDRRAGLRETVSTAVLLGGRPDAWSRAVVASASERVRRVVLRDVIPVTVPPGWRVPLVLLAAGLLGLRYAPRHDLSGLLNRRAEAEAERAEIRAVALEIRSQEQQIRDVLAEAGIELPEDERADTDPAAAARPGTPEEIKRSALKKLTKLNDELSKMKQGDTAKRLDAMRRALNKLRSPGPGPLDEFARRLARGDFAAAKSALDNLAKSIESGEMTEAQKSEAAEQLRRLASQMEALARQRDALRSALEQAGMDPAEASKLAADPDALKQALEQMQGLSPDQRQSLMNTAMNQQAACDSMQSMAGSMSRLARSMADPSQTMNSLGKLGEQLTEAEMMQAEMRAVNEALRRCSGQMQRLGESMCNNPGFSRSNSSCSGISPGIGPGIGAAEAWREVDGDAPPADDYILKSEKTRVRNLGGPVIGSTLVYGAQIKGEARARFGEVARASAVRAAEAIETMQVQHQYRNAVRHYFGRLEAIAGRKSGEPSSGEPAPADDGD